jgi:hypothetical protein
MTPTESGIQNPETRMRDVLRKTEELVAVLETDIQHIQESLLLLDRLRGLLIKHDVEGLQGLLQQLRAQADAYASIESRRQRLQRQLAVLLDCPMGELTLSRLAGAMPGALGETVARQRMTLRDLVDRLGREYHNTSVLLTDCVRFNHALFHAVFQQGKTQSVVYGATGAAQTCTGSHMMNVQL